MRSRINYSTQRFCRRRLSSIVHGDLHYPMLLCIIFRSAASLSVRSVARCTVSWKSRSHPIARSQPAAAFDYGRSAPRRSRSYRKPESDRLYRIGGNSPKYCREHSAPARRPISKDCRPRRPSRSQTPCCIRNAIPSDTTGCGNLASPHRISTATPTNNRLNFWMRKRLSLRATYQTRP
jgi:hypothetical protein